jgi:hypothetical protein
MLKIGQSGRKLDSDTAEAPTSLVTYNLLHNSGRKIPPLSQKRTDRLELELELVVRKDTQHHGRRRLSKAHIALLTCPGTTCPRECTRGAKNPHHANASGLTSLRSLILASPFYHATYAAEARHEILTRVALRQLDYRLRVDSLAAVRSTEFYCSQKRVPSEVIAFIDEYSRAKGAPRLSLILPDWLLFSKKFGSISEATALVLLRMSVKHIASEYCRSIPQWQTDSVPLSELEQVRLSRAIYRFQIYCNLFGVKEDMETTDLTGMTRTEKYDAFHNFLPRFPPWEVQEIACIWRYFNGHWGCLLREVSEGAKMVFGEHRDEREYTLAYIHSLPVSTDSAVLSPHEECLIHV